MLNRLTGLTDSTALLRALAASDLPREGAVYRASLASADDLTASLGRVRWQILDQLAVAAAGDGGGAEAAASIRNQLSRAASHDEHEVPLRGTLDQAERAAIDLLFDVRHPVGSTGKTGGGSEGQVGGKSGGVAGGGTSGQSGAGSGAAGGGWTTQTVAANEVAAAVEEIRETARKNPEARFAISWRIIPDDPADNLAGHAE